MELQGMACQRLPTQLRQAGVPVAGVVVTGTIPDCEVGNRDICSIEIATGAITRLTDPASFRSRMVADGAFALPRRSGARVKSR
jgi:hypothetical protein